MKQVIKLTEDYEVIGLLGVGGMAEVYRAVQSSLGREVAIKKLKSNLLANEEMVERFYREARTAANLQHENIVQVYQFGGQGNDLFIVMEYVDGVDLKTLMKRVGPVPWEVVTLMIREIAKGLAFAHQRGLVHRDIKPSNIIVSKQGELKIMDFGIVRELDSDLTKTGAFLGTPYYMSPEQFRGEKPSFASDLFSLGVVFYELLTGVKPFKAEDEQVLARKIISEREKPVRKLNPQVPRRVQKIIKRILAKEPRKRYGSASILVNELDRVLPFDARESGRQIISDFLIRTNALEDKEKTKKVEAQEGEKVKVEQKKRTEFSFPIEKKTKRSKLEKTREKRSLVEGGEQEAIGWFLPTIILLIIVLAVIFIFRFLEPLRAFFEKLF